VPFSRGFLQTGLLLPNLCVSRDAKAFSSVYTALTIINVVFLLGALPDGTATPAALG